MGRLTRRGISSAHLAHHRIINPKPYRNWNTFSLRLAVLLALRIARTTIKIVSLRCNTHLNAMVGCCGRSVVLYINCYYLFCLFSAFQIVVVDYIGDVEIRECHQQGVDRGRVQSQVIRYQRFLTCNIQMDVNQKQKSSLLNSHFPYHSFKAWHSIMNRVKLI